MTLHGWIKDSTIAVPGCLERVFIWFGSEQIGRSKIVFQCGGRHPTFFIIPSMICQSLLRLEKNHKRDHLRNDRLHGTMCGTISRAGRSFFGFASWRRYTGHRRSCFHCGGLGAIPRPRTCIGNLANVFLSTLSLSPREPNSNWWVLSLPFCY